jgi:D-amino-acid dehydrogenase
MDLFECDRMQHIIVIGGGVVGLASSWWLLEAGCRVTLVERGGVGTGTSYANGGQLSYRYVSPFADAGVPLKALRWMRDPDGPFQFRPRADPHQWRWLLAFLAHCRASVNRATTARLLPLGELSRQALATLDDVVPPERYAWREAGKLVVYRDPALFAAAAAREDGSKGRTAWDAAACIAREPSLAALGDRIAGGLHDAGEAVADCYAFCLALADAIRVHPRFAGFVRAEVSGLDTDRARVTGLRTDAGPLGADAFVLAAGMQSRALAATARIDLPLYPLKGYSLSAPIRPGDAPPAISVTDFERKVLYARIGDTVRVAALADLVGDDSAPDARRVAGLLRQVRTAMPQAADWSRAAPWAGLRPATPDGAPILGATPLANLWLNVGHGGLGFTFACGCARVLAEMVTGREPALRLDGLMLR